MRLALQLLNNEKIQKVEELLLPYKVDATKNEGFV
jgi:hypothetical protein